VIGKSGKIITFYSYKGGAGRSMAVSNVAWILASNGCDVLLIDWDLEAPGLHRYLRPFLVDPELTSSPGVIDFVWDAARVNVTPADKSQATSLAAEFPSLEDYVIGLNWDFNDNGSISFIPAGRQEENYAQRVNTFSWDNFYERLGGGKLLQAEIEALRKSYDFILIDSRTGVSDTSGICTVQLPDMLVVFFTLNRQSIKGAAAVASSVRAQRGASFPIYPVPTRIENGEQAKLKVATAYARRTFAPLLLHVQSDRSKVVLDEQIEYWHEVETPYISFYAFEEVPAAFMEERGSLRGVLASTERLVARMSDQRVTALKPETDELRRGVVAAYEFREDEDGSAIDRDKEGRQRQQLSIDILRERPDLWDTDRLSPIVSRAVRAAFHEYARQYEEIRKTQQAGNARTARMNALIIEAINVAQSVRLDRNFAQQLSEENQEGTRIIGIAVAQARPYPEHVDLATKIIHNSLSPFEQFHALLLARAVVDRASPDQREALRYALLKQVGTPIDESDRSRAEIKAELLNKIDTETPAPRRLPGLSDHQLVTNRGTGYGVFQRRPARTSW
jgi:MinD-like ATPase involved in chromosome partitioning or flagellar assembly